MAAIRHRLCFSHKPAVRTASSLAIAEMSNLLPFAGQKQKETHLYPHGDGLYGDSLSYNTFWTTWYIYFISKRAEVCFHIEEFI